MTYELQPDVVLVTICDEHFLVAAGEARGRVPYVKGITGPGAFFWKLLEQHMDVNDMICQASRDYSVSEEKAAAAFWKLVKGLQANGYLTISEGNV